MKKANPWTRAVVSDSWVGSSGKGPQTCKIKVGTGSELREFGPYFSRAAALAAFSDLVLSKIVDGDSASPVDRAILGFKQLPEKMQQGDLFLKATGDDPEAMLVLEKILGLRDPEYGAGIARVQLCTGECRHDHHQQYDPHGMFFVNGLACAVGYPGFSHEGMSLSLARGIDGGLFNDEEVMRLTGEIASLKLAHTDITRADQIVASGDIRFLEHHLGLHQADFGSGSTRFEPSATKAPGEKHGYMYAGGRAKPYGPPIYSVTACKQVVEAGIDSGYFTDEDRRLLAGQIAVYGLPATHVNDGKTVMQKVAHTTITHYIRPITSH